MHCLPVPLRYEVLPCVDPVLLVVLHTFPPLVFFQWRIKEWLLAVHAGVEISLWVSLKVAALIHAREKG